MKQIILLFACLFALQGLAKADDDRAITVDQLPQKAQEFIQKYFPKNEISLAKMEKDFWEKKYEVVFVNGEKAEFLKDGSWEKVDQLPQKAQEFIQKYFPKNEISLAKMEKDFWEKKYEVVFVNGEKAEFLKDGSWEKVDCKYSTVPTGIVPQAIKDYVSKHYPEAKILKIERDSKTYEVKLNNQLELEFNKAFQLIDIDN